MRNQYLYLSALVFALQGQAAFGREPAAMPDRHLPSQDDRGLSRLPAADPFP